MDISDLRSCLQKADRILAGYDCFHAIGTAGTSRTALAIGLTGLADDEVRQIAPLLADPNKGWDEVGRRRLRGQTAGRFNARLQEVYRLLDQHPDLKEDVSFHDPYALRIMIARLEGRQTETAPKRKRGLLRRR